MEVEFCNWEKSESSDLEEIEDGYTVICVKRFGSGLGGCEMGLVEEELGIDTEYEEKRKKKKEKKKKNKVDLEEKLRECGESEEPCDKELLEENRSSIDCRENNIDNLGKVFVDVARYPGIIEFYEELHGNFVDFNEKFNKYLETPSTSLRNLQNKYIEYLFGIRKDYLYKKLTRGFLRHLGRLKVNILEKNSNKLNFFDKKSENFRDLYKESHEFYCSNHEIFSKLTGTIKYVTLSNCYKYFSDGTIKHLFQLFTVMLFTCKPRLQLSSSLKIPADLEFSNIPIWEMRKIYIKDMLFLFQSTPGKLF